MASPDFLQVYRAQLEALAAAYQQLATHYGELTQGKQTAVPPVELPLIASQLTTLGQLLERPDFRIIQQGDVVTADQGRQNRYYGVAMKIADDGRTIHLKAKDPEQYNLPVGPRTRTLQYTLRGWKFADEATAPDYPYSLLIEGPLGLRQYLPPTRQPTPSPFLPPVQVPRTAPARLHEEIKPVVDDIAILSAPGYQWQHPITAMRRGGRELDVGLDAPITYRPSTGGWAVKGETTGYTDIYAVTFRRPDGTTFQWSPLK